MKFAQIWDILNSLNRLDNQKAVLSESEKLEAIISYDELHAIIKGKQQQDDLNESELKALQQFLVRRWERIQGTYLSYPYNTQSTMNRICVAIADLLQHELEDSRFKLLIPTLESNQSYITLTDFNEDELAITDVVLSDEDKYMIEVYACFDGAVEDNHYKHTQKMEDHHAAKLSANEKTRVIFHSKESELLAQAIDHRFKIKHSGNSVGSLLQMLIEGLRAGGAHRDGLEMNAAEQANLAILNFSRIYQNGLSNAQRETLNNMSDDHHNFFYYWDILALRQQRKIDAINKKRDKVDVKLSQALAELDTSRNEHIVALVKAYQAEKSKLAEEAARIHANTSTCVEITSNGLEALLTANKDALFAMKVDDKELLEEVTIVFADNKVKQAKQALQDKLKEIALSGDYFAARVGFKSYHDVLKKQVKSYIEKHVAEMNLHRTALYLAVEKRDLALVEKTLEENKELLNIADVLGVTPVHLAAKNGDADIMQALIRAKADLSVEIQICLGEEKERTALAFAAARGHGDIVNMILETGYLPECGQLVINDALDERTKLLLSLINYRSTRGSEPEQGRYTPAFYFGSGFGSGYDREKKISVVTSVIRQIVAAVANPIEHLGAEDYRVFKNGRLGELAKKLEEFYHAEPRGRIYADNVDRSSLFDRIHA